MLAHTNKLRTCVRVTLGISSLYLAGCASLPDADAVIVRHEGQRAQFENALGPLSERRSAAIVELLKSKSGDIDMLDKQIALEQAISDSPLLVGNRVKLLQDGPATYEAMFAAIRAAHDHINLESYIIEDDAVGKQFADLLIERQNSGVQVNVIYDSMGCLTTPDAYFERLQQAGIQVLEFNPVNPLMAKKSWLLNNRDHRKLLVVDGRIAFIGGINISDVYSSGSGSAPGSGSRSSNKKNGKDSENKSADDSPWRDTDLQLEGPVVGELQKLFMDTWQKQKGEPLAAKEYFPMLDTAGSEIVRSIGSTPDDPYSQMYLTLISAIGNAEKHILLTNAYFVPDPQFLQALMDAAQRGVDVKLILPSYSDSSLVFHAGRSKYTPLLESGVKIYERMDAVLHSKTAVIDGVWSTVGSSNLDWRSFSDNDEVNAVVLGKEFGEQMMAVFSQDLESSQQITLEQWKQRSMGLKVKESLSQLWERLL